MEFAGEIRNISTDWASGETQITFSVRDKAALIEADSLRDSVLSIKADKYRKKRTTNANALMWTMIGQISNKLNADKWEIYLRMLKRYGQYTYICVKPRVVEAMKLQWRECEVLGDIEINGEMAVQMLCYFGSSTYNTQEFSKLLEGIKEEMIELCIQPPASEEMRRSLEEWEKNSIHQSY